jgi:hypothetical protein
LTIHLLLGQFTLLDSRLIRVQFCVSPVKEQPRHTAWREFSIIENSELEIRGVCPILNVQ